MAGELRFDLLTGEWVSIVGHRQDRPNLPVDGCPFCVGGLEAPEAYDTLAFRNRWPAYDPGEPIDLDMLEANGVDRIGAVGDAEVVLYSPRHTGSLASLGTAQVRKVIDLWADRTAVLLARPEVAYVLVFESRGTDVGATIHHPHGQIYAFPMIPPGPAREAHTAQRVGECVVCAHRDHEANGDRLVFANAGWVAAVPFASRYPYGVDLMSIRHVGTLSELTDDERDLLAEALVEVIGRYDRLWSDQREPDAVFSYLMWFHQAPAEPEDASAWHLHAHFAPPYRAPGVFRYIAAGEVGSGTMSNPVLPEHAAETLRSIDVSSV